MVFWDFLYVAMPHLDYIRSLELLARYRLWKGREIGGLTLVTLQSVKKGVEAKPKW